MAHGSVQTDLLADGTTQAVPAPDELEQTQVKVVTTGHEPVTPAVHLRENLLLRVIVPAEQVRI